jgi:hypothetical protein
MNGDRHAAQHPASNPFSTRHICPAATSFLFPVGIDAERLVDRLRQSGWWGQIVGPHGSGKSTLVRTLSARIGEIGRRVDLHGFQSGDNNVSAIRRSASDWDGRTQVVIDGYEQLGRLDRLWLKRRCRMRGTGLLVTAHEDVGLPELWRTETTIELARAVVARLLPAAYDSWITESDISHAFLEHRGDLRETLLALYDIFEDRAVLCQQEQMAGRVQVAPPDDANASE